MRVPGYGSWGVIRRALEGDLGSTCEHHSLSTASGARVHSVFLLNEVPSRISWMMLVRGALVAYSFCWERLLGGVVGWLGQ